MLDSIMASLAEGLPPQVKFEEDKDQQSRPNSILWIPTTASYSAPRGLGGAARNGPLFTRELTVVFRVWGEGYREVEELLNTLVNAAHVKLSQHSYQVAGEEWFTGGATSRGVECKLAMILRIPIARTPGATVPLPPIVPTFTME